jgi:hypothetical protein
MGDLIHLFVSDAICPFDKKLCSHVSDCDVGLGSGCLRSKT